MMGWLQSNLIVQMQQPWRYTTQPTYNPDGTEATPGVKQTLDGVFILLDNILVTQLKASLTQAEKDELQTWVEVLWNDETKPVLQRLSTWHAPGWAGEQQAVYVHVPTAVWNDPVTAPPAKVKAYFQHLWREAA